MANSNGISASIAGRYATALFALAQEKKSVSKVGNSLSKVNKALSESDALQQLTIDQAISRDDAKKAVASVDVLDETYLVNYREKLKNRSEIVSHWATNTNSLSLVKPQAGFFTFLNIADTNLTSNEFCARLIEEVGVATTPGLAFGAEWDDHIRLSFAVPEHTLNDGLQRVSGFLQSLVS